ncbi:MAG: hypothetical protein KIT80_14395 [Chitinophagaceae bacterium]|nr:hypothetical protein [Chitinophagaceae bacterium]MCW5928103.1 hypothetical protein [Chitinophagaceae bacterium]
MNLTLRNEYGNMEAVIEENCGFGTFYDIADLLKEKLQVNFTNKIDDLDSSYWDFHFRGQKLTLHYNIKEGVSILPVRSKDAAIKNNDAMKELVKALGDLNLQ